jgi:hypothetical protein
MTGTPRLFIRSSRQSGLSPVQSWSTGRQGRLDAPVAKIAIRRAAGPPARYLSSAVCTNRR